ncbi:MAG TPA: ABC transporter substrate-binding protein [Roseomonas sp.]|jgi:peptide/nickel transport system substrate-binding protein
MRRILAGLAFALSLTQGAAAQSLRVAMAAEPTAVDPHNYAVAPNSTLQNHLYDSLVGVNAQLQTEPGLAVSWTRRDDRTWEFQLREGVTFSNGQAFSADDVIFTFCRVLNNETETVGSFSRYVRRLARIEKTGDHGVTITTNNPEPLLLSDLSNIAIIARDPARQAPLTFDAPSNCGGQGPWPTLAQFNDGSAGFGTGPYRLRSYTRGGAIELVRNEHYWGEKPHWREVRLLPVTSAGPRLAGLFAGDFDIIEAPATGDIARLRNNPGFGYATSPTTRLIFLQLDQRNPSPFVTAPNGGNPLTDARVRRALSLAIDRRAIVQRVMDGIATPAIQLLPDGMPGTLPDQAIPAADPARARALLAEAGYPNGFSITLHATNNRYVNDARIAQTIAQYFTRIGVRTEVDAMPSSAFFTRRGRREFSVAMGGWSADANETLLFIRSWLGTMDRDRGVGMSNYGSWSNADFDRVANVALTTMDADARAGLLRQAGAIALEQMPVIPLHFESAVWAFRRGITYPGRVDQTTLAAEVRPAD